MGEGFSLFVDESGDSGIGKLRTTTTGGSSPYMTLGAALIPNKKRNEMEGVLSRITAKFGKKSLHCNQLSHLQKVYFAKVIAGLNIRLFGLISRKETLGGYWGIIEGSNKKYYNKCAQLLLEKVGKYSKYKGLNSGDISIYFEDGNFNYTSLWALISKCRERPLHKETEFLKQIEPMSICAAAKDQQPLLQIADLVAHALYRSVDKTPGNFGITEPRYLQELEKVFASNPADGRVEDFGIKCVHCVGDLGLDDETQSVINSLQVRKLS